MRIVIEPIDPDSHPQLLICVSRDELPDRYVPGIISGLRDALSCGPLGYPVMGIRIILMGFETPLEEAGEHVEPAAYRAITLALQSR